MPDDGLFELADRGQLSSEFVRPVDTDAQGPAVGRALSENFAGQWLRSRDVEHAEIDAAAALGRDREIEAFRERYHKLRRPARVSLTGTVQRRQTIKTRKSKLSKKTREQEIERLRAEFRKVARYSRVVHRKPEACDAP